MRKNQKGFILPLSVMLMTILAISGINFLQFDFLERRMTRNELDNHTAFYLANAGIERARTAFKVPPGHYWTPLLAVSTPADDPGGLCSQSDGKWRGCLIPPFGATVSASSANPLPFDSPLFDDGQYEVRAFNNVTDPNGGTPDGTVDTDRKLTYRARAIVGTQTNADARARKILELENVQAKATVKIINCEADPSIPCPNTPDNPQFDSLPGHEPASVPGIPTFDQDFYRDTANLPCSSPPIQLQPDTVLVDTHPEQIPNGKGYQIQSDTCYYSTGNVTVKGGQEEWDNVVVFSDQVLSVVDGSNLTNSILIGLDQISLSGEVNISAPKTNDASYPVLVSEGTITNGDVHPSLELEGIIFAETSVGTESNPWGADMQGSIIAGDVFLGSAYITDSEDERYYSFMPGFVYPAELIVNETTQESVWKELQ